MKDWKRLLSFLLAAGALVCLASGCAEDLLVKKFEPGPLGSKSRHFALLTQSRWDPQLIKALAAQGFRVEATPSAAEMGLSMVLGDQIDICTVNENIKIDRVTLVVTDRKTETTLLTLSKGGATGPCAWHRGSVFEDLALALARLWEGKDPNP